MIKEQINKSLFIIGMDNTIEQVQKAFNIHSDDMLVLQIYGPVITEPYSDLMRDIILSVYEENVEEIYVVGTKGKPTNVVNMQEVLDKIYEKEELREQREVLDYLFKTCMPEFPETSMREWLEGSKTIMDGVQTSVQIIRNHSLVPSNVNVRGIIMDKSNGNLSELKVS
ncbi:carbonic anhydrase [Aneurinibacillus sp. Ricciae_BoGa-3]|uniref:carbonic anhydrase n=1 Tax=Aneurinibacillus sp. Ricciae_BoGa-3 TaxID=3022697 RepID=UPI002340606D|nr:carbonic anhydrase [Aneurinibacillus sp. Ricciae_BoGa-3]WCK54740.1 carbonic anhydrase [Aneurinibacillus sp. Ricciae_BoGa-3]